MEDLDFSGLPTYYSNQGRTGYNLIILYDVVAYAIMRGVRDADCIVELCEKTATVIQKLI